MILECVCEGETLEVVTRAHGNVSDMSGKIFDMTINRGSILCAFHSRNIIFKNR